MNTFWCLILLTTLTFSQGFSKTNYPTGGFITVVNGEDAIIGEIPYQIELRVGNGTQHYCGGSLISVNGTQVVLTAAHCLDWASASNFTLVAGEIKTNESALGFGQFRNVSEMIIHELWGGIYKGSPDYDIAIMKPDRPFQLNSNVSTIALPYSFQNTSGLAMASGWGNTNRSREFDSFSNILQKVIVPVLSDEECLEQFGDDHPVFPLPNYHSICTTTMTDEGEGVCSGDSGGPLRSLEGNYVAGIVSYAKECAMPDSPTVYTEVSHYIDWIEVNVAKLSL